MSIFKYILFDCMETLIDLTELPAQKDYALWAYKGSGCEGFWESFEEFFDHYQLVRKAFEERIPDLKEHEISERFDLIVRMKLPAGSEETIAAIKEVLCRNFWRTYTAKCYVKDDVRLVLPELAEVFRLGVVSNFVVKEGIEQLLCENAIDQYFSFVVTSVREGWRKPHPRIYQSALEKAQVNPEQILFVGDDFACDYMGPRKMGFQTLLLDRYDRFRDVPERINGFHQLLSLLKSN